MSIEPPHKIEARRYFPPLINFNFAFLPSKHNMKCSYIIPKVTMFNLAFNKKKQKARQQQMMQLLREGASSSSRTEQKQGDEFHDDDTTSAASDTLSGSYRSNGDINSSSSSFISSAAASTSSLSSQRKRNSAGSIRRDAPSPPGSPSMKGCLRTLPEGWEPSPVCNLLNR